MKFVHVLSFTIFIVNFSIGNLISQDTISLLRGPYFGQKPPGTTIEIFTHDVIKNCPSFSPDKKEIYFRGNCSGKIMFMKMDNNQWTQPQIIQFSDDKYSDVNPHLSPDGTKLVFASNRPLIKNGESKKDFDIFMAERVLDGWSKPKSLGSFINSKNIDGHPTMSNKGNLYFFSDRKGGKGGNDIYMAKLVNGRYSEVINLDFSINSEKHECDPLIAPDESYLIFCARDRNDGYGNNDLYISFKKKNGKWTRAKNMGKIANSQSEELFPSVSSDGKYFFFSRSKNGVMHVYWVSTLVIEKLRSDII